MKGQTSPEPRLGAFGTTQSGEAMQGHRRGTMPRLRLMAFGMIAVFMTTLGMMAVLMTALGVMVTSAIPAGAAQVAAQVVELKVGISEAVNTVLAFWMA